MEPKCYPRLEAALKERMVGNFILSVHDAIYHRFVVVPYDYIDNIGKIDHAHEVLCNECSRLIFDFDLPTTTRPITSVMADIKIFLINFFHRNIGEQASSILQREKVKWIEDDSEEYPPFAWAWRQDSAKTSIHLTLPLYVRNRVQSFKVLYRAINTAAKKDPQFYWVTGDLVDSGLWKKNASLRLPGMQHINGGKVLQTQHPLKCVLATTWAASLPPVYCIEIMEEMLSPYDRALTYMKGYGVESTRVHVSKELLDERITALGMDNIGKIYEHKPTCQSDLGYHLEMETSPYRCPVCNVIHDGMRRPFFTQRGNCIKLTCWRYMETKPNCGKELFIHRDETVTINWEHIEKPTISMNQYDRESRLGDIRSKEEYISAIPDKIPTVSMRARMGRGKSTRIREYIESHTDKSVLVVGTKIAHVDDMMKNMSSLGFVRYEHNASRWVGARRLIVQLESLYKCELERYDIVILDEVESIFKGFVGKTIQGKEFTTTDTLIRYIREAETVISADANMTKMTREFIEWLRPLRERMSILDDRENTGRSGYRYISEGMWTTRALEDKRKKFMVFTSAAKAIRMANLLATRGQETLLIVSDEKAQEVKKKLHLTVNERSMKYWDKVQNLIISPTITCGVSYDIAHFDAVYVYGGRNSCHPMDLAQMTKRVRFLHDQEMHLYIKETVNMSKINTEWLTFKSFDRYMNEGTRLFDKNSVQPGIVSAWRNASSEQKYLYANSCVKQATGQLFFDKLLLMYLEYDGWSFSLISEVEKMPALTEPDRKDMIDAKKHLEDRFDDIIDTTKWPMMKPLGMSMMKVEAAKKMRRVTCISKGLKISSCSKDVIMRKMDPTVWCQYDSLMKLFSFGGGDLDHMQETCTLRFSSNLRKDKSFIDCLAKVYHAWSLTHPLDGFRVWANIERFMKEELLCIDVQKKEIKVDYQYYQEYTFRWPWNDVIVPTAGYRRSDNGQYVRSDIINAHIILPEYHYGIEAFTKSEGIYVFK